MMKQNFAPKRYLRDSMVLVTSAALIVSGCATTRNAAGGTEASGGCNPALMTFAGALLGALAAGKNNRNQGAVIGGAIGGLACLAWNYQTQQTKTAALVNQEYKQANNGVLPSEAKVVAYNVAPSPSTLSAGSPMVIRSDITIVEGSSSKTQPNVEEELEIMHNGKSITKAKKQANADRGGGAFSTKFTLDLPRGSPQGFYPVNTTLYLDGRQVETRSFNVQVVQLETGVMVAMLR